MAVSTNAGGNTVCLISDLAFDIVGLADLHPWAVGLRLWVGENLSLLSDCGHGTSRL